MTRVRSIVAVGMAIVGAACASSLGPPRDTRVSPAPRALDKLSNPERGALLDRAQVWRAIDTRQLDLLAGPRANDAFPFDADVKCGFHFPDKPLTGVTPKFQCELGPDDVVKVKYGANNGEVFAEVAATRLFWALGFIVDRMYPVKVTCVNCPPDPHLVSTTEWRHGKPANGRTLLFDPAAIERAVEGGEIEVPGYEGWSWRELDGIAGNRVGATRAQIDALKLLAVLVQHVDSKPEQQAIVCPEGSQGRGRDGSETCSQPLLMVKDLGSTFGAAKKMNYDKMKLESWRSTPIWKDAGTCQGQLTRSIVGTLEHPVVSEEGRRFLAERLMLLSDRQLHALFTAARVERRKDKIDGRQVTADDWVRVFKQKRDEIVKQRCQVSSTH